jgi:uncharacterized protein with beta-barrel porin domain
MISFSARRADYSPSSWGASARFVGAPASAGTFQAVTALPRTVGKVNVGAELYATERAQFKLEYGGEFGRDHRSNVGMVKFNYLF